MKKVIIFIPSIEDGGVEKNLFSISNYLKKKKLKVEILSCDYHMKKKFLKGINFIGTKNKFWFNKSRKIKYFICLLILFFKFFLIKKKPLIFAFQANIFAILIAKVLNLKIITRSNSAPIGWLKSKIKTILYKFLIHLADDVMVNSLEFKRSFKKRLNVNATCIYNPFDKSLIKKRINDKIKDNFFKKDYLNIVSVGRLTDQKDHITLLKSINLLKKNFKIRLVIIGKGKKDELLNEFIFQNKLQNKIKLTGYLENPYPYIYKSNMVILTSKFEGLPNILLEAQYLKKYIISTDCPTGPKEILLNGSAGDLIKIGDYNRLSLLIKNFHKRKKIISKKINFGFKNFDRFDFKTNCNKYLDFIIKNQ